MRQAIVRSLLPSRRSSCQRPNPRTAALRGAAGAGWATGMVCPLKRGVTGPDASNNRALARLFSLK
jgi:hypothetical protein